MNPAHPSIFSLARSIHGHPLTHYNRSHSSHSSTHSNHCPVSDHYIILPRSTRPN